MTTYEPGTVAVATVRGVPNVRVLVSSDAPPGDTVLVSQDRVSGEHRHNARLCGNVRPLVVLDLGPTAFNADAAVRILRAAADAAVSHSPNALVSWIADQIEAQTRPPKPAEPTGLGAVVEDVEGERWVRVNQLTGTQEWRCCDFIGEFRRWPAIDAVRVLSPGVQP